jgi:hypothetical protein
VVRAVCRGPQNATRSSSIACSADNDLTISRCARTPPRGCARSIARGRPTAARYPRVVCMPRGGTRAGGDTNINPSCVSQSTASSSMWARCSITEAVRSVATSEHQQQRSIPRPKGCSIPPGGSRRPDHEGLHHGDRASLSDGWPAYFLCEARTNTSASGARDLRLKILWSAHGSRVSCVHVTTQADQGGSCGRSGGACGGGGAGAGLFVDASARSVDHRRAMNTRWRMTRRGRGWCSLAGGSSFR